MHAFTKREMDRIEDRHWQALGLVVCERRKGMGWSQEELARRTGLSRSEIQYIERGLRHPKSGTQRRLAAAFGISGIELAAQVDRVEAELASADARAAQTAA